MSNIAIRVNDTFLELPADFVFSQIKTSPLYFGQNINFIPGNYTLPATVQASPQNRTALGYRDFIDNVETFSEELPADVFLFGNFHERGRLTVKFANPYQFRLQFFSGTGELATWSEKSIRDYDLGEINLQGTSIQDLRAQIQAHFNDTVDSPQNYTHLWHKIYIPNPHIESGESILPLYVINMYVKDVLRAVLESEGFEFEANVFDSFFESRYLLFFTRHVHFAARLGDANFNWNRQLNTCVPDISPSSLISDLAKTNCWCFYVNSNQRKVIAFSQKDVVNAQGVDRSSRVTGRFERSQTDLQVKRLEYQFSNPEQANHELAKDFPKYRYIGNVENITDLPSANVQQGDIMYVFQLMAYVSYFENFVTQTSGSWDTDNAFQDIEGLNISTSGTPISSKCGTVYVHASDENDGYGYQTDVAPFFRGAAHYTDNTEPAEDFAICCYYGKYQFRQIGQRPLVSYYPYSTDGQYFGRHSLRWRGTMGIYARQWQPWIEFVNTSDSVQVDMLWTENDLTNSDLFLKPMYLFDEHSGTKQKFLLREMKIVVGQQDGLRESKQKLIQMREITKGK